MLTRWIDTAILIIFTSPVLVISRLLIWREAVTKQEIHTRSIL